MFHKFILKPVCVCAVLTGSWPALFSQITINLPPPTQEQELVRKMLDSVLVIVRQDYALKAADGSDYFRRGYNYYGRGYNAGVLSEGKIWVESGTLRPWTNDSLYLPYAHIDSLTPVLKRTAVRLICQNHYQEISISSIDTFPGGLAGLSYDGPLKSVMAAPLKPGEEGWGALVFTEQPLTQADTCPLRISVFSHNATMSPDSSSIVFTNAPVLLNPAGGAFFSQHLGPGSLRLLFCGLLKKKLLSYRLIPFVVLKKSGDTGGNAPGSVAPAGKPEILPEIEKKVPETNPDNGGRPPLGAEPATRGSRKKNKGKQKNQD